MGIINPMSGEGQPLREILGEGQPLREILGEGQPLREILEEIEFDIEDETDIEE